jgi:DNA-binding CsgD family transcriptional regulator
MLKDVLTQKGLSHREAEVAELVTKGLSNKEVASQLFVTEKTVKFHLTNIYKKMAVKSRAQLIVWCLPHGVDFINSVAQATNAAVASNNANMANANASASGAISSTQAQSSPSAAPISTAPGINNPNGGSNNSNL